MDLFYIYINQICGVSYILFETQYILIYYIIIDPFLYIYRVLSMNNYILLYINSAKIFFARYVIIK